MVSIDKPVLSSRVRALAPAPAWSGAAGTATRSPVGPRLVQLRPDGTSVAGGTDTDVHVRMNQIRIDQTIPSRVHGPGVPV